MNVAGLVRPRLLIAGLSYGRRRMVHRVTGYRTPLWAVV
jgi:hypothetical protein